MRLAMIDDGAYALTAGVPEAMLGRAVGMVARGGEPLGAARAPVVALGLLAAGGLPAPGAWEVVQSAWSDDFRGDDLERLARGLGSLGTHDHGPPPEMVQHVLDQLGHGDAHGMILHELEMMQHGMWQPGGYMPPGMAPGDDPAHMRGPGGMPDDPDHQGPHGHGGDQHGGGGHHGGG